MEVESLADGRTKLLLTRREDSFIDLSLLNALYRTPRPGEEAVRRISAHMGVSAEEAMSLKEGPAIISVRLFGFPTNLSLEHRDLYRDVLPKEPRKTGTAWDKMPKIEAELLPEERVAYVLARSELPILAGTIDMMLGNLAPRRDRAGPRRGPTVRGRGDRGGRGAQGRAAAPRPGDALRGRQISV